MTPDELAAYVLENGPLARHELNRATKRFVSRYLVAEEGILRDTGRRKYGRLCESRRVVWLQVAEEFRGRGRSLGN